MACVACTACGRSSSTSAGTGAGPASAAAVASSAGAAGSVVSTPTEAADAVLGEGGDDLWARAKEGEADDLARLADREGPSGLIEKAKSDPKVTPTAARAAAFSDGLASVAWLSEVADGASDDEAKAALESLADIAARPRKAVDPEDAPELREACDRLVALATDDKRPRERRVLALRFVRMMADRGCAGGKTLPSDVDAKPKGTAGR